jgi:hypothetical protein
LLQLLDAIRYIKKIPDASIETSCKRFLAIIKNFTDKEINTLGSLGFEISASYKGFIRCFVRAIAARQNNRTSFQVIEPNYQV